MHHHAAAAGVGSMIETALSGGGGEPDGCRALGKVWAGGRFVRRPTTLGGREMPDVGPGDILAFLASGAYGLTFSPTMFLSHPRPAEIMVDSDAPGAAPRVVRTGGRAEDSLRDQVWDGRAGGPAEP